ncbi:hypothetical protein MKW98_029430, partial [Papaver atlanticum]
MTFCRNLIPLSWDSEDDGGAGDIGGFTYDMSLASMHTYLGGRFKAALKKVLNQVEASHKDCVH